MYKIQKGRVLIYRVFDIGEEINLEKVSQILTDVAAPSRSKFTLKKSDRQAVIVSNDPLTVNLGNYRFTANGKEYTSEISAKVWDFGTLSLTFDFLIPEGFTITQLKEFSSAIQDYEDLDVYARSKSREFAQQIQSAMAKVNEWEVYEDYILYYIEKFTQDFEDASDILKQEDIAALILNEEKNTLSPQSIERIYDSKLQYYKNDLALIDWNSAFVIEPSGSLDIPDVIEFAMNQLLEMRYYDDLLDKKLREIYSAIELKNMSIFSSRYNEIALGAGQNYIEIAEIVESVENSLKVIGDLYHSTVFRSASKKFRFADWQTSIDNKLKNLADISALLLDNINNRKSHILELTIIALISVELIPLLHNLLR